MVVSAMLKATPLNTAIIYWTVKTLKAFLSSSSSVAKLFLIKGGERSKHLQTTLLIYFFTKYLLKSHLVPHLHVQFKFIPTYLTLSQYSEIV